ncbi:polysaccharide deacetylase family protein [uncultured Phascolarctobacterium sp.]|uniref:polysaccharide deacetylase family protein n=1 Tax=Phascolarctobacterium sp. TaxID=2049039 RepID=UPI0025D15C89|nr:polysaccharide deacetylase family protein [uncultured Phascolarctobacterium sp.]
MKIVFSWDDGALEDQKLFELHEKYSIPGMFFVPTYNREERKVLTPYMLRNAKSENIFFGGHTFRHTYLTDICIEGVDVEILNNKKYLEDCLGYSIDHFCLPGGKYNSEVLKKVFKYFSTVRTAETMNFYNDCNILRPSLHFYPRGIKSLIFNALLHNSYGELIQLLSNMNLNYFDLMKKIIDFESTKEMSQVLIWGHSWEIEENGLWDNLDMLFEYISVNYLSSCVKYDDLHCSDIMKSGSV